RWHERTAGEYQDVGRGGGEASQGQGAPFKDFGVRRRAAVGVGLGSRQDENFVFALLAIVELAVEKPQVMFEIFQITVSQADYGNPPANRALQRDQRQGLRAARQPRDANRIFTRPRFGHEPLKIFILFKSLKASRHYKLQDSIVISTCRNVAQSVRSNRLSSSLRQKVNSILPRPRPRPRRVRRSVRCPNHPP